MVNNVYPSTILAPVQKVNFRFLNNERVSVVLLPQPNPANSQIHHVEVDASAADSLVLSRLSSPGSNLTLLQAGALALQYAQSEAQRRGTSIYGGELEGEEFLELSDVANLSGNAFPLTLL